ncbi:hypothetical protein A2625_05930 [candidate division WOR-1 bacterium RIFCSPHIGHO2_01_FULL_53_15]|uniref:DUF5050 domain-containing protein n=1 Tax=candidate division WOR-1 bacterium RIFCSPHIGHO2_01_FULL_53_15 TaxID=1802564 RepID=A0A1F4Q332_UNCSA|nr:MAG: hypothetical protein A2625_05930 [candidate division WOR-1 bacterium RIFCSPHIGHO2_01_FULL_53_15]OGC13868.1 MAG: hypothetical protein A3D23_02290 [candidate division WOR-1 bacterium RIFCSPHIGHO2_02_FULL_53_26]
MLAVSLLGCSEKIENSYFYYGPGWTRLNKVAFITGLQSVRKDAIGTQLGSTYTETLTTMEADGTGASVLFDVTGAPPYHISSSPTTDYIAYLDGLRGGLFAKVVIRNIAAGAHTGADAIELAFNPGIVSFDWSNNALKIVYVTTTEVHTVNLDGTGDTAVETGLTDVSFVTWKYGTKVAFVHVSGGNSILSLKNGDGTGARTDLAVAASVNKPQISSANTNLIYGIAGGALCSVDISAGTPATTEVLGSFAGELPRLSPDATKVVYSKASEDTGVYLIDLTAATKAETKIK